MTQAAPKKSRLLGSGEIQVSFEFFPPKSETMEQSLWASIRRLEPLGPTFVSVTYGAGGTTRERTHNTVSKIVRETTLAPAAHLTCVGATRAEVDAVVQDYKNAGVRHVVALRGDPAGGIGSRYEPHPGGYATSTDLVAGIAKIGGFDISVGGYPEMHPESGSLQTDIDNLKRKVDAGATRIITQFFFDNDHYLRFVERCRTAGIWCPILPGIQPIQNFKQIAGFASKVGTTFPAWFSRRFEGLDHDPVTSQLVGAALCAEQVSGLVDEGVRQFHFYTQNRADLSFAVCHLLGLRAKPTAGTIEKAA